MDFLVCAVKIATAMPPPLCIRSRRHLFRWTPRCMVLANSTNFIEDMSCVHHRSKPLMTTTATDTFFCSPNRGTKVSLCGWQEWEVYSPVRWTMLGPSSVHEDNSKCYFVNQNVCTNAQCHLTIRREQCHPTTQRHPAIIVVAFTWKYSKYRIHRKTCETNYSLT